MPHVIVQIEMLVVDPDGMTRDRRDRDLLAEARGAEQPGLDLMQDEVEIDSTGLVDP